MHAAETSTVAQIAVREARVDDLQRLAAWNAALIRDERHDDALTPAELRERLREWLASEYRACVFEADGEPVGYALYRELSDATHLRHFFIVPAFRRNGIGRRAFERLRTEVFPHGKRVLVEVLTWNDAGIAFWKAIGFGERYLGLQYPAAPAAH